MIDVMFGALGTMLTSAHLMGLMLLAVVAFHSLIAKPFYIPSISMIR